MPAKAPAQCPSCVSLIFAWTWIAGEYRLRSHCCLGHPGAPLRTTCDRYERVPGTDDEPVMIDRAADVWRSGP